MVNITDILENQDNIRRWLEADESELCLLKESDKFYVVP